MCGALLLLLVVALTQEVDHKKVWLTELGSNVGGVWGLPAFCEGLHDAAPGRVSLVPGLILSICLDTGHISDEISAPWELAFDNLTANQLFIICGLWAAPLAASVGMPAFRKPLHAS